MDIVITGASSGIGKGLYEWFSSDPLNKVVGVSRRGPDVRMDLVGGANRERAVKLIFDRISHIDVLINNAGMMLLDEQQDFQESLRMIDLNLIAVWHLTLLLELRIVNRIINIASISGIKGEEDVPLYAATKAGVIALTKSFAKKYINKGGLTVNCISPGFFETNLVPGDTPQELVDGIPMKREAKVDEIIPAVEMIIKSHYMTGANIVVDGGICL